MKTGLSLNKGQWLRALSAFIFTFFACSTSSVLLAQSETVVFRDDFNDGTLGDDWEADYNWAEVDGYAYNYINGGGSGLITARYHETSSYVIETAAMGFKDSYWREYRILFGQDSVKKDNTYILKYDHFAGGRLTLERSSDNIYFPKVLAQVKVRPKLKEDRLYRFKIIKNDKGLIQVYLNEGKGYGKKTVLEVTDNTYKQLGHFGWYESTQGAPESFYVDWIEARSLNENKPPVGEGPVEDHLILKATDTNGQSMELSKLNAGVKSCSDCESSFTVVPAYIHGASFVPTPASDKTSNSDDYLKLYFKEAAIVYVGYDAAALSLPTWLEEWEKTGDFLETDNPAANRLALYSRLITPESDPVVLGGNLQYPAVGAQVNYMVAAIRQPKALRLEAETAYIYGAEVARNHQGYSGSGFIDFINLEDDFVEWTVQIDVPGTYSIGFGYGNGNPNKHSRNLAISVDGIAHNVTDFEPTSGWDKWATVQATEVYLGAGVHTIKVEAVGKSGPNLDYLEMRFGKGSEQAPVAESVVAAQASAVAVSGKTTVVYPNPFSENATIIYTLDGRSPVQVELYNMAGQRVEVLVDEVQEAGEQKVTFRGNSLPKGLYFYRIKTAGKLQSGKLLKQ